MNNYDNNITGIIKKSVDKITIINDKKLTPNSISIVMTTNDRITQTLYTLLTISQSSFNDFEVILVDDSCNFIPYKELEAFNITIVYIQIKNKFWINPCVNNNIGLFNARSEKIILQNAEVCHVGDVLKYVSENLTKENYIIFDVLSVQKINLNNEIYDAHGSYDKIIKNALNSRTQKSKVRSYSSFISSHSYLWVQHGAYVNTGLNYLTAIHKINLLKLGNGFDLDFMNGSCFDDGEFIFRINYVLNLQIHNVNNETTKLMGIHQCHSRNNSTGIYTGYGINSFIYHTKKTYFLINNVWPTHITFNTNNFFLIYLSPDVKFKIPFEKLVMSDKKCIVTIGKKISGMPPLQRLGISHTMATKYMHEHCWLDSTPVKISFVIYTINTQTVGKKIIYYKCSNRQKYGYYIPTGYTIDLKKQNIVLILPLKCLFRIDVADFTYGDNMIIEDFKLENIIQTDNNIKIIEIKS